MSGHNLTGQRAEPEGWGVAASGPFSIGDGGAHSASARRSVQHRGKDSTVGSLLGSDQPPAEANPLMSSTKRHADGVTTYTSTGGITGAGTAYPTTSDWKTTTQAEIMDKSLGSQFDKKTPGFGRKAAVQPTYMTDQMPQNALFAGGTFVYFCFM